MIGTFRKHSKALWWIIIVVIIVVFVYWGSSTSRTGDIAVARDGNYGIMNGEVITPAIYQETMREVYLNYFYSSGGRWPGRGETLPGFNEDRELYQRLFLIQKAREMGIHVSDEALGQAASARMRALNQGNPVPVGEFENQVLRPAQMNLADFERFIRHELAIQQLVSVISAGGELLTPAEVEALYRHENQEAAAQVVFFHATNDLTAIAAIPEKISEFYSNRLAYYRIPERVQINYVSYPLSNFLAAAKVELDQNTNLNEIIEARYEQLGTNYFSDAKSPEEAKQRIREEFAKNMALGNAGKEARKLEAALYEKTTTNNYSSALFAATAQEHGLTPQVTAPFTASEPPLGLDVAPEFSKRAFALTADEPLSELLGGEDHIYVIGFHSRLPSEIPSLASIQERVTQDYRFVEAATAAQQAAINFYAVATNGLNAGKSFAALCEAAGLKPVTLTPFARNTRGIPELAGQLNEQNVRNFIGMVFATEPGRLTPLLPSADGAMLGFVQALLPINETAMKTNLPAFTRSVQQMRRGEVFNEWFRAEASKAFASIPFFQKQSELSGPPGR